MKRLALLLCCVVFATGSSLSQFSIGVHGNAMNFNTGGVANDIYGLGLGGGIHLDFGIPFLSIRVSGDYTFLNPDKNKYSSYAATYLGTALAQGASIDGGKLEIYSGNANAKLVILPLPVIHIYATGGIGLARVKFNDATINIPVLGISRQLSADDVSKLLGIDSQTRTTTNVGAGVDIALGGIAIFGELKLNWIWTSPNTSSQIPIGTVGITF